MPLLTLVPQRRLFLLSAVCLPALLWSASLLAAPDEATDLVKRTADRIISTLQARRGEVERDPSLIYGLIETAVAPHFDFERIAQGALGQYWRTASPDQQRQLVGAFKQVLIRTYARALLSYSGEEIRYLPSRPGNRPSTITVSTEVRAPGAAPIPVDYRMLQSDGRWRVYDVVINNASLVGNYRTSFATEVRQSGIAGLLRKLDEMNRQGLD